MFYVYVLRNEIKQHYIGYSVNLRERLTQHNAGTNASTRGHVWQLLYYEAYQTEVAARDRERILKHDGRTRRWLMERLYRHE